MGSSNKGIINQGTSTLKEVKGICKKNEGDEMTLEVVLEAMHWQKINYLLNKKAREASTQSSAFCSLSGGEKSNNFKSVKGKKEALQKESRMIKGKKNSRK